MRALPYVALLIGCLLAFMGFLGLSEPEKFAPVLGELQRMNIYVLAGARIVIGVILLLAAGTSRAPYLLGVVGVLIILGGLITPFMGAPLKEIVLRWWADGSVMAVRAWSGVSLVIGAFVVWATRPRKK
jgi:hypothetical protein